MAQQKQVAINNSSHLMEHHLFNHIIQPPDSINYPGISNDLNLLGDIGLNSGKPRTVPDLHEPTGDHCSPKTNSPADLLSLFIDSAVIEWMINETCSQSVHVKNFQPVTEEEIRCFIAILYMTGYVDVPRRRMFWERSPDAHCPLVSNALQRDRFEAIFTALHLGETNKDEFTRFYHLRPLVRLLNERFLQHAIRCNEHSIAECTANAASVNKTRMKPIKLWCACTKTGYCVWFDFSQQTLLQGHTIILNYAQLLQRTHASNYSLIYERYYSDTYLLQDLQSLGVHGACAERDKTTTCLLNPSLGGVDRLESNMNLYRSCVRSKKSYATVLTFLLDLALSNAWQLYRLTDRKLDLLAFRRNIVVYYLQHYAKPILGHRGGRPMLRLRQRGKRAQPTDARFDGIRHFVIPQAKQTRCGKCTAKTTTRCQKCDIGVHVKCFVDYHQRPNLT